MPTTKLDRRSNDALPGPLAGKGEVIHWDQDLPGFGLRVLASGARTWIVRYRVGKRQRVVSLGKGASLSPMDARKQAGAILAKAKPGKDARTEITEARSQATDIFKKLAESYLAKAIEPRRRPSYVREVRRYLLADAAPLHELPVASITRKRVAGLLDDISSRGPFAADCCRVALSGLFAWAMRQGLAEGNPAATIGRIAEPKARERALSAEELGAVWQATEGPGDFNAAVRLLMLTGQRREEVGGMTWGEIDARVPANAVWRLPGSRTKNHRPHDVPLSAASLAVLERHPAREGRALVFGIGEGGFSGWSKGKAAMDARIAAGRAEAAGRDKPNADDALAPWRLHDLRRSVVTHMAEIGIQPHVIEAVVNHVSGHKGGIAGVYNRATYAAEKRAALERWAEWLMVTACASPTPGHDGNVVPMRRATDG
jgi:integrase